MDVTDVLRDRMHDPSGMQTMVVVSIGLHAALVAAALVLPGTLFPHTTQTPATVMTISLGGGEGPRNGGLTALGGRPVQTVTPPEAKREAVRPPAAKTPEMTVPMPKAKPTKAAPPRTSSSTPRVIETSARLNAGQEPIAMKSVTAPFRIRSARLPIAPPATRPAASHIPGRCGLRAKR